ncbi:MAG: CO/xanthine dehydrogenase FAD-binding subunit/carbon monoxide dehydrogenase subunit G [Parasphingorhabdus sp.]|jgi:CO/xanthine dehydrogenase FAD-binding subunit/carbon monoxide dehydrogenase subunit G
MLLQGHFEINAPRAQVWNQITNPGLMAACIPGCESIEQIDATTYQAIVAIGVGVVKAKFNLLIEVTEENPLHEVRSRTSGLEGKRTSTLNAENRVWLAELDNGHTRVDYESEVSITGRLGKFGLGIMRKHVEKMSGQFATNFEQGILNEAAPADQLSVKSAIERDHTLTSAPAVEAENEPVQNTVSKSTSENQSAILWPTTIAQTVEILCSVAGSHPLAGGATLIAMRNAGLVDVKRYVSLERVEGLQGITTQTDGSVRIGAMTRHCDTAASKILMGNLAVLRQAAGSIASMPVRNMGTMGGSLANADPAADYLAALTCIDAKVEIAGPDGTRTIAIDELISDWYETTIGHGEIITTVVLPAPCPAYSSYRKVARVSGDFAVASCAISVNAEDCVRIAIGGCGPYPIRQRTAELFLSEQIVTDSEINDFSSQLASLADPVDDVRGSAVYRRNLIPQLVHNAFAGLQQNEAA